MEIKSETFKHIAYVDLNLLTSNDIIIKSRYYLFNGTTCIVNISVYKHHLWFNVVYHKPLNGGLNLNPLIILSI